ncbi:hypothetical protein J3459_017116 [Metarhizium acridum]|nr:hypothetical protein J3459_017116 [Metarhizium acridum]
MQFAIVLSLIATASADGLLPSCSIASGSPCGIASALGQNITFPNCTCNPTCEGTVTILDVDFNAKIGE